jgi:hypothetical protein
MLDIHAGWVFWCHGQCNAYSWAPECFLKEISYMHTEVCHDKVSVSVKWFKILHAHYCCRSQGPYSSLTLGLIQDLPENCINLKSLLRTSNAGLFIFYYSLIFAMSLKFFSKENVPVHWFKILHAHSVDSQSLQHYAQNVGRLPSSRLPPSVLPLKQKLRGADPRGRPPLSLSQHMHIALTAAESRV